METNVKFNLGEKVKLVLETQLYRSWILNHACRHLTASCRTARFGSSRAFDIARSTWKLTCTNSRTRERERALYKALVRMHIFCSIMERRFKKPTSIPNWANWESMKHWMGDWWFTWNLWSHGIYPCMGQCRRRNKTLNRCLSNKLNAGSKCFKCNTKQN